MNNKKETTLLLPKGEWLEAMLIAFKTAGLELTAPPRSYEYSFANQSLPIIFQAIRSKEVADTIFDWDTNVNGGFTGSDIAIEQRVDTTKSRVWEFPLDELNPNAPQPWVYMGSTPNLRNRINQPTLTDIQGTTIYTEYPLLTQKVLQQNNINAKVKSVQGGSEGRWRVDPNNGAIVTIRNTDATMKSNQIEPMLNVLRAKILYIEGPNISRQDQSRIDDLKELIFRATQGKRT